MGHRRTYALKKEKALDYQGLSQFLAETKGFEPLIQVLPGCSLSRGVPSTSRPRLPGGRDDNHFITPGQTQIDSNQLGGLVEAESLVQNAHGQFQVFFVDDDGDLDFRGRYHLDVDAFFGQCAEHLAGDAGV